MTNTVVLFPAIASIIPGFSSHTLIGPQPGASRQDFLPANDYDSPETRGMFSIFSIEVLLSAINAIFTHDKLHSSTNIIFIIAG